MGALRERTPNKSASASCHQTAPQRIKCQVKSREAPCNQKYHQKKVTAGAGEASCSEPCPAALTALVWERRSGCSMDVWKEMGKSTALIGGAVMELGKRVTCSAATGVNRKTKRKEKACGKTNINTQPCHSQLSSYLMSTFSPCAVH